MPLSLREGQCSNHSERLAIRDAGDMPDPGKHLRFFIVTAGRSRSTLLCAILADAGADFGLPVPADWQREGGELEHPAIKRAVHHLRRAYDLDRGRRQVMSPWIEMQWRRHLGRRHLREALGAARFLKISDLDLAVQPAFRLGYLPRVILSFRPFEAQARSLVAGRTFHGPDELAEEYVRTYRQGLLLLHAFGGCVVAHADMHANPTDGWLTVLAKTTGLDAARLQQAASARVAAGAPDPSLPVLYPEARAVYETMCGLCGRVLDATPQVERAFRPASLSSPRPTL
jgi:hypothetical protein